jgi:hypothetical protein
MKKSVRGHVILLAGVTTLLLLAPAIQTAVSRSLRVRVDRWLALQNLTGTVMYRQRNSYRAAQRRDRLQSVGDGITTGHASTATLEVDTGVGTVHLAENTALTVRSLDLAPDNGRVTYLDVPYGQVRLQLRHFTHSGSRLEIQTPSGISAVRGTVFGMSVQSNGKTGVATLTGKVATIAQGQTVLVPAGFQNLTITGEPPSQPVPLRDSTELHYRMERQIQSGIRRVFLLGQVDPVNTVLIGSNPQEIDRNGRFQISLPAVSQQTLAVTVITPLGKRQVHQLLLKV